jgi:hypothetical protein
MRRVALPSHRVNGAAKRTSVSRLIQRSPLHRIHAMPCASGATRSTFMMDILLLALGLAFFAAAIGYTYACERL